MPRKTSEREFINARATGGGGVIAIVMNSILLIFGMIITYPSALPKDRRLVGVVEAELMHSSQGEHHPWGTEADPSSSCRSRSVQVRERACTCVYFLQSGWWECVSVYPWEDWVAMHT